MFDSIQFILVYGFILGSLYLLISFGFSIVCGVLRIFHMGYGAIFVVGVYAMWMLMDVFHLGLWGAMAGMFVLQVLFTLFIIYVPVVKRYLEREETSPDVSDPDFPDRGRNGELLLSRNSRRLDSYVGHGRGHLDRQGVHTLSADRCQRCGHSHGSGLRPVPVKDAGQVS